MASVVAAGWAMPVGMHCGVWAPTGYTQPAVICEDVPLMVAWA